MDAQRTPETVSSRVLNNPRWRNHPDYNQGWITRIRARCVVDAAGCWLWQGHKTVTGYGQGGYRNRSTFIHRAMYQAHHGVTLKTKQYVCHRCDVRSCCNPDHLFLGDQFANMHDSVLKGRHAEQLVTHCPRNHEYDAANTYVAPGGSRHCKACKRYQLRLKAGWPEELALHPGRVPAGHTKEILCQR